MAVDARLPGRDDGARLRVRVGVLAAIAVAIATASVAGSASGHTPSRATNVKVRCCWEATISASVYLQVEYPCAPPGASCADPNSAIYPYGVHQFSVDWRGQEIFQYRESNRAPGISAAPELIGASRVWTYVKDHGLWDFAPNDGAQCLRVTTTDPKLGTAKPHWLLTNTFFHFVPPGRFIRVSINRSGFSGIFSKCGLGVSYHGANANKATWDGLNEPWVWMIKGPTRDQWRHAQTLQRTVTQDLPRNELHGGPNGGAQHYVRAGKASLFVLLRYIPRKDLGAEGKRYKTEFPLNSPGLRLVTDDECRPC